MNIVTTCRWVKASESKKTKRNVCARIISCHDNLLIVRWSVHFEMYCDNDGHLYGDDKIEILEEMEVQVITDVQDSKEILKEMFGLKSQCTCKPRSKYANPACPVHGMKALKTQEELWEKLYAMVCEFNRHTSIHFPFSEFEKEFIIQKRK